MTPFSLNINGELRQFDRPQVMGILNVTPDSFYAESRAFSSAEVMQKAEEMARQGADIIDIGAYSTRPGCEEVSEDEELRRLEMGMEALRKAAPDILVSVDTFRSAVARKAVSELGANIINDISGGQLDPKMAETAAELHAPYIAMHMRGTPADMQENTDYDNLLLDIFTELAKRIATLELAGVNDIIIDPGFGFSKTLEQNYMILKNLSFFKVFQLPVLVGVSRKSMVTKLFNISADEALAGTTSINMYALQHGAAILRVHDVAAAAQSVKIYEQLQKYASLGQC
ncbi:MAG: dihydropteroate synthase [Clostridium sp.]|nr:dihydropteroate synthase [Clostridium sp.]